MIFANLSKNLNKPMGLLSGNYGIKICKCNPIVNNTSSSNTCFLFLSIQWNLLRRPPLGEWKSGRLTEVAVLKGGRLERFYCSVFLGRLLSYKKFFSSVNFVMYKFIPPCWHLTLLTKIGYIWQRNYGVKKIFWDCLCFDATYHLWKF